MPKRRTVMIGLGGLAAGGGALVGTGAFDTVEAERTVSIEVASDADALLGLLIREDLDAGEDQIGLDFDRGLNLDAETVLTRVLLVQNNGTQSAVGVKIDDVAIESDDHELDGDEAEQVFSLRANTDQGTFNGSDGPVDLDPDEDEPNVIDVGEAVAYDLVIDIRTQILSGGAKEFAESLEADSEFDVTFSITASQDVEGEAPTGEELVPVSGGVTIDGNSVDDNGSVTFLRNGFPVETVGVENGEFSVSEDIDPEHDDVTLAAVVDGFETDGEEYYAAAERELPTGEGGIADFDFTFDDVAEKEVNDDDVQVAYEVNEEQTDPEYHVGTVEQVQAIEEFDDEGSYRLVDGVDASDTDSWNDGDGFNPIDDFEGEFDGYDRSIFDLSIDRSSDDEVGLFGEEFEGAVRNLRLDSPDVTGEEYVGSLIGEVYDEDATVENVTVESATVTGEEEVGGIIGEIDDKEVTVEDVTATKVEVRGEKYVGGIVGEIGGEDVTIEGISANGIEVSVDEDDDISEAGGLVGKADDEGITISDVSGTDITVTVEGEKAEEIGGVVGKIYEDATIRNVDLDSIDLTVEADDDEAKEIGGLVGKVDDDGLTVENVSVDAIDVTVDTDDEAEEIGGLVGDFDKSDGTIDDVTIGSVDLTVDADDDVEYVGGLVGEFDSERMSDVRVESSNVTVQANDDDVEYVGGLVGYNDDSTIERALATTVNVDVESEDDDSKYVGGLIGRNSGGKVSQLAATAGEVEADGEYVGGLFGRQSSSSSETVDSYARVDVTNNGDGETGGLIGRDSSGEIKRSYSTGTVSGDDIGGLIADKNSVEDSYWDTEASGVAESDGGEGLQTDEMQGATAEDNMDGFHFDEVWETVSGGYPVLRWE